MKLGLFTPVFGKLNQDDMLAKVRALGRIQAIELGTGGWPGHDHLDVDALVSDERGTDRLKGKLTDAGLTISALSCHGNPLHPDKKTAQAYDDTFRKTVCLAKRLDVPVVVTFSGCPGDSDDAKHPNWITTPWPPEFLDVLEWKRIVSALRLAGYDYVMSIEHEDALASIDEGLNAAIDLLSRVILTEQPVEAWWT